MFYNCVKWIVNIKSDNFKTLCWYRVFITVILDDSCFRPMISVACFKMSFSIRRRWFFYVKRFIYFLQANDCPLKEPVAFDCLIQRSKAEAVKSYSSTMVALDFPFSWLYDLFFKLDCKRSSLLSGHGRVPLLHLIDPFYKPLFFLSNYV